MFLKGSSTPFISFEIGMSGEGEVDKELAFIKTEIYSVLTFSLTVAFLLA